MKGYPTIYNGVIFIETALAEARPVANVSADLSFKIGAQLKNLNNVKHELVIKAAEHNCNCITEFKYGQKSRWLAIDDVAYFGSGIASQLPPDAFQKISEYISQRNS